MATETRDGEEMLLDFPGWLGRQDPDTRTKLQRIIDLHPPEEQEAERGRIADMHSLAEKTGEPIGVVADNWDHFRGWYAETKGGPWTAVRDDDNGFHALMKDEALRLKDERHLLQGLDDDVAPLSPGQRLSKLLIPKYGMGQLEGVTQQEQAVTEHQKAFEESLRNKAERAAFDGKSAEDALAEWQATASAKPGYDASHADFYAEKAREIHGALADTIATMKPVADEIYDKIAKARGVQEGEGGSIAPIELLRGKSPQEKQVALELMRKRAGDGPEKESVRGLVQASGEALGRSFENLIIGGNMAAFQSYLIQRKPFKEGDTVTENNGAEEARQEFRADDVDAATTVSREYFEKPFSGRKLTSEEAEQWNRDVAVKLEDISTVEQLRKFGQQVIDPVDKSGSWARRHLLLPAADSAALMASMMTGPGAAPAFLLRAESYHGEEFQRQREQHPDGDPRLQDQSAKITGFAQSALDQLEFGILSKGASLVGRTFGRTPGFAAASAALPATTRALEQFSLAASKPVRFAINTGLTTGGETLVELTQDHLVPALIEDNFNSDPRFDVNWGHVWVDFLEAAPETMLGMVLISSVGALGQMHVQSKATLALGESPTAMRLRGYSQEEIAEITESPKQERGKLLARYLPEKAPTGEERKALVEEVVASAKTEQAAFKEKAAVDVAAASDAADYAVRVARSRDGWQVTKEDGSTLTVESAEAARRIRDDLKQAASQREADDLVAAVENWHERTPEGDERNTVITGDMVTSDGTSEKRVNRFGSITEGAMSPRDMETLRQEATMDLQATGHDAIAAGILGKNYFQEKVSERARAFVQHLEVNRSNSALLTFLHESIESDWRVGVTSGAQSEEGTQRAIANMARHFDPAKIRDEEQASLFARVQKVARGEASSTELRETLSELAVADILGRNKEGGIVPAGSVSAAMDETARLMTKPAEIREVGQLRAFFRAMRAYFRAVIGTVAALRRARRDGSSAEFDAIIHQLTGTSEQAEHEATAAKEAERNWIGERWSEVAGPTPEELEAGIAFSLRRKLTVPEFVTPDKAPEVQAVKDIGLQSLRTKEAIQAGRAWIENNAARLVELVPKPFLLSLRNLGKLKQLKMEEGEDAKAHFQAVAMLPELLSHSEPVAYEPATGENPSPDVAFYERRYAWADFPDGQRRHVLFTVRHLVEEAQAPRLYSVEALEVGEAADGNSREILSNQRADTSGLVPNLASFMAGVKPEHKRGDVSGEHGEPMVNFRLATGTALERVQKRADVLFARDPEQRREVHRRMLDRLQKLQYNWETERLTAKGDVIRPVEEQRLNAELNKEQAVRQAFRADELTDENMGKLSATALAALSTGVEKLEDRPLIAAMLNEHGKLVSKTTAARRGRFGEYDGAPWLPPKWYAGPGTQGLMPDEMAQALYDSGMLREPSPDALWSALGNEVASYRDASETYKAALLAANDAAQRASQQAREEGYEWRREEDRKQKEDWSPKAKLLRYLRTLDAMLSVLPAEIRGKVGGFVKLATLGSEEARTKELERRLVKMSALLEKQLQKESREKIEELFDRARPDTSAGQKPKGSMTREANALTQMAEHFSIVPEDQVAGERAKIETELLEDGADVAALAERLQVFEMFAGMHKANATALDRAATWLDAVVRNGKNQWRIVQEQRLADMATQSAALRADTGKAGDVADLQRGFKADQTFGREAAGWGLGLMSFEQTMEAVFGQASETRQALVEKMRKATYARTDAVIEKRATWKTAMAKIFGSKAHEVQLGLWEHAQVEGSLSIEASRMAGRVSKIESIPLEIAERAVNGTEETQRALGFDANEVGALEILLEEHQASGSRKENVDLERFNEGTPTPTPMSQLQAVGLLMMSRQQDQRANLDYHGWTKDVLTEIDNKLTPEARGIMQWLGEQYRDEYAPINSVFERMFGAPLPQIQNYSPLSFESLQPGKEMTPDGSGSMGLGGLSPGALKTRRVHRAAPRLTDALASYWSHTGQMEHFKAFAEVTREARSVMLRPEVRASVQDKVGRRGLDALQGWVSTFENDGVQTSIATLGLDTLNTRLQNAVAVSALSWNVGTMVKQSLATLNSAYEMPSREYLRGFGKLLGGRLDFRQILGSQPIRRRVEAGASPELRQVMAGLAGAHPGKRTRLVRELVQRGMDVLGEADGFFTAASAAIHFDWAKREALAAGLGEEAAAKAAMDRTQGMIDRTSQPVELMNRSLYEAKNATNPAARWLFMFASEARQKAALYVVALAHVIKGEGNAQDARVLAISHLVVPLVLQSIVNALRDARDDDDDELFDASNWNPKDYLTAVALGPLAGYPLLGGMANSLISAVLGRPTFRSNPANPLDSISQIPSGLKKLAEGDATEPAEKGVRFASSALNILSAVSAIVPNGEAFQWTGAVGNGVKQIVSWIDNFTPDTEEEREKKAQAANRRESRQ